jgi:hypothetical protein
MGVENLPEACENLLDDDFDGYTDCDDYDCQSEDDERIGACTLRFATEETVSCSDGIDNDGDGRIDCRDMDFITLDICTES